MIITNIIFIKWKNSRMRQEEGMEIKRENSSALEI